MENKKYDWVASLLYQPELSLEQFHALDITPQNTGIKDRDYYKKLDAVRENNAFKDEDGDFDESTFDTFYDGALMLYNDYANKEQLNKFVDCYQYDPWAWWNSDETKVRDVSARLVPNRNPMRETSGIKALGLRTSGDMSVREIAQTQKIYDIETGKFLDKSPNDYAGFFTSFTAPTVVLATYDDDEEELINGEVIKHKKGDIKLNENGAPFYETLGNREIYGKQVLHASDIFSVDGSTWNKFDFFDSDSLSTDVWKVVAKNVVRIAPYILTGPAAPYIAAIGAAGALLEFMPTFLKSVDGFFTNDAMSNSFGKTMNTLEGFAARFDQSVSDESQQRMLTLENVGKMFGDVSLQLFTQKAVANIPRLLTKNPKIWNNAKLASGLSYAYMSATSAQEAYGIFKQAGADDRTAGLAMWAMMGVYYKLMSADYYKHALFRNSWIDEKAISEPTKAVVKDFQEAINKEGVALGVQTPEAAAKTFNWFQKAYNKAIKIEEAVINKGVVGGKSLLSASLSEGVEEVMEEVGMDTIKCLSLGLESLGFPVSDQDLDFGFSPEDIAQRYLTSFLGGAFGGAVFHGYNLLDPQYRAAREASNTPEARMSELVYLISQNRQKEIYDILAKWKNEGALGSKDLSGTKFQTVTDLTGSKKEVASGSEEEMNQNDFVYNEVYKQIKFIENLLKEENFIKNRKELQKLLNIDEHEANARLFTGSGNQLSVNATNLILNDLNRLGTQIVKTRAKLIEIENSHKGKDDTSTSQDQVKRELLNNSEYQNQLQKLEVYRKQRDAIYNKENISNYILKASVVMNKDVLNNLLGFSSVDSFAQAKYGKPLSEFNIVQQELITEEYNAYFNGKKFDVFEAADIYDRLSNSISEILVEKEKLLGKVSLRDVKNITVGNQYINAINQKRQLEQKFQDLSSKENKTEEDLKNLESIKKNIDSLESTISFVNSNPTLTSLDATTEQLPLSLDEYAEMLLNVYQGSKGSYKFGNSDIQSFINLIKSGYNKDLLNRVFNDYKEKLVEENGYSTDPEATMIALGYDENNPDDYIWSVERDTQIQEEFLNLLGEFYDNLGIDNQKSIETVDKIKDLLKTRGKLNDGQIKDLLYTIDPDSRISLIPKFNERNFDEYLKELNDINNTIIYSQASDLLKNVLSKIGEPELISLLDVLNAEQNAILNLTKLDKYTISNPLQKEQLQTLQSVIRGVLASVDGSQNGLNNIVNKYKKEEEKLLFGETSYNTAKILHDDLTALLNKVNFILDLDLINSGQKLKEQAKIGANMRVKFLQTLTNPIYRSEFERLFTKDESKPLNIENLIIENTSTDFDINEVTSDNYPEKEKEIINIETALYNVIKQSGFTDDEISDNLVEIFGKNSLWHQRSSKLTSKSDEIVTDYDSVLYWSSVLTLNTNDFYVKYRDALNLANEDENEESKLVPVFGQEYALRLAYAVAHNQEYFNKLIEKIANTYQGDSEYIKSKIKLNNLITVFGGAGTGKTQAVAKTLKYLFDNAEFRFICPTEDQLKNLMSVFKDSKVEHGMTIDAWIDKYSSDLLNLDNISINTDTGVVSAKSMAINTSPWHGDENSIKLIVVDEIGMLNAIQLKALSEYAESQNILVVGLGDYKQNSGKINAKVDGKEIVWPNGFEDCFAIKTPDLSATFRANVLSKALNYDRLNDKLTNIYQKIQNTDEAVGRNESNNFTEEVLTGKTELDWAMRDGLIYGDFVVKDANEFKKLLDRLTERNFKVLVVTDPESDGKYVDDKYDKFTRKNTRSAQGGEYDFVFVDKKIDVSNKLDALKDLYTISQRGTLGSIILDVNEDYSKILNIITNYNPTSLLPYNVSLEQKGDFINWRMRALNDLNPSEDYNENVFIGAESVKTKKKYEKPIVAKVESKEQDKSLNPEPETEEKIEEKKQDAETTDIPEPQEPVVPDPTVTKKRDIRGTTAIGNPENWVFHFKENEQKQEVELEDVNEITYSPGTFNTNTYYEYLYGSEFYSSAKSNPLSLYNWLKQNKVRVDENGLRNLTLWISRKVLNNESFKDGLKGIPVRENAIRKLLENNTPVIEIRNNSELSEIVLRFKDTVGEYLPIEIPIMFAKGLPSGQLENNTKFSLVQKATYNRSNETGFITIGELKRKYPWLRFGAFVGTMVKSDDVQNSANFTDRTKQFNEQQDGKSFIIAFDTASLDPNNLFRTSKKDEFLYLYTDSDKSSLFGIQNYLNPNDVIFYAAAMNYLYDGRFKTDSDEQGLFKLIRSLLGTSETNSMRVTELVLNRLASITGNSNWNQDALKQATKGKYHSTLRETDKESTIINYQQVNRLMADLFGEMVRNPKQNRSAFNRLFQKLRTINDRSFALILNDEYILWTDQTSEYPKVYFSKYNSTDHKIEETIQEIVGGNVDSFSNGLIGLMQTLSGNLENINSNNMIARMAELVFDKGEIQVYANNSSLRSLFDLFDPNSELTSNQLSGILNRDTFKYGLFGNIPLGPIGNDSYWGQSPIKDSYITRATEWIGDVFMFDTNKIISENNDNVDNVRILRDIAKDFENKLLNSLKQYTNRSFVDSFNTFEQNIKVSNLTDEQLNSFMNQLLEDINNIIYNEARTISTPVFVLDENMNIKTEYQDSKLIAFANLISDYGDEVPDELNSEIIDLRINVIPSVDNKHYLIYSDETGLKIKKIGTYESWKHLRDIAKTWDSKLKTESNTGLPTWVMKYISNLLNGNIDESESNIYWNYISNLMDTMDQDALSLQNALEKYLIDRIENNECE